MTLTAADFEVKVRRVYRQLWAAGYHLPYYVLLGRMINEVVRLANRQVLDFDALCTERLREIALDPYTIDELLAQPSERRRLRVALRILSKLNIVNLALRKYLVMSLSIIPVTVVCSSTAWRFSSR
jgi:hypothetical protein